MASSKKVAEDSFAARYGISITSKKTSKTTPVKVQNKAGGGVTFAPKTPAPSTNRAINNQMATPGPVPATPAGASAKAFRERKDAGTNAIPSYNEQLSNAPSLGCQAVDFEYLQPTDGIYNNLCKNKKF